jgi:hypothetical protein
VFLVDVYPRAVRRARSPVAVGKIIVMVLTDLIEKCIIMGACVSQRRDDVKIIALAPPARKKNNQPTMVTWRTRWEVEG